MNEKNQQSYSPGSIGMNLERVERQSTLTVPDLISELYAAVEEFGDLTRVQRMGRLLGTLCARLEAVLDLPSNRFSRVRNRYLPEVIAAHPAMSWDLLVGGTFVDLGCGALNPFSGLAVLKAAGAGRCIGIDLDPLHEGIAVRALARTALELIGEPLLYFANYPIDGERVRANLAGLDISACLEGDRRGTIEAIGSFPIEYRRRSAEDTGLDDASVNGITSLSFLEHVADPDAVLAEMARISRPGAIGTHAIDGIDHRSYAKPEIGVLDFLSIASDEPLLYGCNRIRPLDFVDKFERHGFEVVECETVRRETVTVADCERMAEPFRSMPLERLLATGVRLAVVRR